MKLTQFLTLIILASCSSGPSKKHVEKFAQKVTEEKTSQLIQLKKSSSQRLPLKVGQWVKVVTEFKTGVQDKNFLIYKVIKIQGNLVKMEIESMNASNLEPKILQYEIENYPMDYKIALSKKEINKLVDKMVIKQMKIKVGENPVEELSKAYLPMAKGLLKNLFISGHQTGEAQKSDCSSEYLSSELCHIFDFEASLLGSSFKGKTYAHSEVPIVGFLKMISEQSETKVINFGLTGAKASF